MRFRLFWLQDFGQTPSTRFENWLKTQDQAREDIEVLQTWWSQYAQDKDIQSDEDGNGLLHFISGQRNIEFGKDILDKIASFEFNINAKNILQHTPLLLATIANNRTLIEWLLNNGAYVDSKIIEVAAQDLDILQIFNSHNKLTADNINAQIISKTISINNFEAFALLIPHLKNANEQLYNGNTLLHESILNSKDSDKRIITILLNKPYIDVIIQNNDGNTPLHIAEAYASKKIFIKPLLKNSELNIRSEGIIPYIINNKGISTYMIEAKYYTGNNIKSLCELIECNHLNNEDLESILFFAHEKHNSAILLTKAIKHQNNDVVYLLLNRPYIEIDMTCTYDDNGYEVKHGGITHLMYACLQENYSALKLMLEKRDIDINQPHVGRFTMRNVGKINTSFHKNIDTNIPDYIKHQVFNYALSSHKMKAVEILLNHYNDRTKYTNEQYDALLEIANRENSLCIIEAKSDQNDQKQESLSDFDRQIHE